jgi:hypothetical protein
MNATAAAMNRAFFIVRNPFNVDYGLGSDAYLSASIEKS